MHSIKIFFFFKAIIFLLFVFCSNVFCQNYCGDKFGKSIKCQNCGLSKLYFEPPNYKKQKCPICNLESSVLADFTRQSDASTYTRGFDLALGSKVNNIDLAYSKGMRFVFIKKSEGNSDARTSTGQLLNPCALAWFKENINIISDWKEKNPNKTFLVGIFHFWRNSQSGDSQADEFLKELDNEQIDLPPMLDFEDLTLPVINPYNQKEVDEFKKSFNDELKIFINKVEKKLNKKIILYLGTGEHWQFNQNILLYNELLANHVLCAIRDRDELEEKDWRGASQESKKFWQYKLDKCSEFVTGDLDLYAFFGDEKDFIKYANVTINP